MRIIRFDTMNFTTVPYQPSRFISYLRVGKLLYYSMVLFVLEALFYWVKLEAAYYESSMFFIAFWFSCFLFAFFHIFLVIMDGWSRFQNYKRVKDQFFMYGYNHRIADMYMVSKCQRTAVEVAASELGIIDEVNQYYYSKGVRWYHFAPYFMVKDPLFLFKKAFWSRTFIEKSYQSKFDYRKMQTELSI